VQQCVNFAVLWLLSVSNEMVLIFCFKFQIGSTGYFFWAWTSTEKATGEAFQETLL